MVLDPYTGGRRWRDLVLRFPSLPLIGVDGAFWGTDGGNLVMYGPDGELRLPQIPLDPNIRPVFG